MRTLNSLFLFILCAAVTALAGDGHDHNAGGHSHAGDSRPTIAVTQWTDRMELFMEYPAAVELQHTRIGIHLTILEGFQPVRRGGVTLVFDGPAGRFRATADEPLREGVFVPEVLIPAAGDYTLTLTYEGPEIRETFTVPFPVHGGSSAIPAPAPEEGETIGFLKEQQWNVPFATATVEVRDIRRGAWAIAEVLPNPGAYAEIVAPVDGVVQVGGGENLALPGSMVERGDVLAMIAPAGAGRRLGIVAPRLRAGEAGLRTRAAAQGTGRHLGSRVRAEAQRVRGAQGGVRTCRRRRRGQRAGARSPRARRTVRCEAAHRCPASARDAGPRMFNFHNYDNLVGQTTDKIDPRQPRYKAQSDMVVALCWAASKGDLSALRRLAASGADLEAGDYDGRTAIHLAASEGHLAVVEYIISARCRLQSPGSLGRHSAR